MSVGFTYNPTGKGRYEVRGERRDCVDWNQTQTGRAVRRQLRGNTWTSRARPGQARLLLCWLTPGRTGRRVLSIISAETKKPGQVSRAEILTRLAFKCNDKRLS